MANILNIPIELQQHIAADLDVESFFSLRLVNRELCAATHDVFIDRHFTTRQHLVTRLSLCRLVSICACPTLNKKLREIEFVFLMLPDPSNPATSAHIANILILEKAMGSLEAAGVMPRMILGFSGTSRREWTPEENPMKDMFFYAMSEDQFLDTYFWVKL